MKIIIAGATGFIGRHLVAFLNDSGYEIVALCRNPQAAKRQFSAEIKCVPFKMGDPSPWLGHLKTARALINLIGENISTHLWSKAYKAKIRRSRLEAVATFLNGIRQVQPNELTFMQASAVGYYGNSFLPVDEQGKVGEGFLARLTYEWERATEPFTRLGVRRILMRFGTILSDDGGALPKLILPYRFFAGAILGNGQQGFSWMHISDLKRAVRFLLENKHLEGVFNFVSPHPVSQKEFSKICAEILNRPVFLRIPAWGIKLMLGEMGQFLIIDGQYVQPTALINGRFEFKYPKIKAALENLLVEK